MMSWHGNTICITGPLWGESTDHWWILFWRASYVELVQCCLVLGLSTHLNSAKWWSVTENRLPEENFVVWKNGRFQIIIKDTPLWKFINKKAQYHTIKRPFLNAWRTEHYGWHFADNFLKWIFLKGNISIFIKSLILGTKFKISMSSLVQVR